MRTMTKRDFSREVGKIEEILQKEGSLMVTNRGKVVFMVMAENNPAPVPVFSDHSWLRKGQKLDRHPTEIKEGRGKRAVK